MSHTFSDLYVRELLRLLREHASPTHDRLVLRGFPGLPLPDLFSALLKRAGRSIHLQIPQVPEAAVWQAIELDVSAEVIPYLVIGEEQVGEATWNQGMRGFAGRLRDFYAEGADRRRVLLILDDEPIETELSTGNPGLAQALESPEAIGLRLVEELVRSKRIEKDSLAHTVGDWYCRNVRPLGASELEGLWQFLSTRGSSPELVRTHLADLQVFRPDPDLAVKGAESRLERNHRFVSAVEDWAARPDIDLEAQVTKKFGKDPQIAERIKRGVGGGVDWSGLDFPALKAARGGEEDQEGEPAAGEEKLLSFAEVPLVLPEGSHYRQKRQAGFTAVVAAIGQEEMLNLKIQLNRAPHLQETVHLSTWKNGDNQSPRRILLNKALDQPEVPSPVFTANIPLSELEFRNGWSFLELSLSGGRTYTRSSPLDKCQVALRRAEDLLYYEEGLLIDAEKRAFVVEGDPYVVFARPAEPEPRPIILTPDDPQHDEVLKEVPGHPGLFLPLWLDGAADEEDEAAEDLLSLRSPEEALLAARVEWLRRGAPEAGDYETARTAVDGYISSDGPHIRVEEIIDRPLTGYAPDPGLLRLLQWEQQITGSPDSLRFKTEGNLVRPEPNGGFDSLLNDRGAGFSREALAEFRAARRAFFAELAESAGVNGHKEDVSERFPTVLLLNTLRSKTARPYVEAYHRLLNSLSSEYRTPYQNLVYCDTIRHDEDLFVAPTHPLSVAYLIRLQGYMSKVWPQTHAPAAVERLKSQVAGFRNTTLPFAFLERTLYHTTQAPAFLWQRLRPHDRPEAADDPEKLGRYVNRVIERFTEVYTRYQDEGQRLVIAAFNPGDGGFLFKGLKRFFEKKTPPKPRIELHLIGPEPCGKDFAEAFDRLPQDHTLRERVRYLIHVRPRPAGALTDDYLLRDLHLPFIHITFASHIAQSWGELNGVPFEHEPASLHADGANPRVLYVHAADTGEHRFRSTLWPGSLPVGGEPSEPDRFRELVALTNSLVLASKTTVFDRFRIPAMVVRASRGLLPEVYRRSVWVSHLDPMIGVEAFWDPGDSDSIYMVDQDTELRAVSGVQQTRPLLAAMQAALRRLGSPGADVTSLLRHINGIAGVWAMALHNPEQPEHLLPKILPVRWSRGGDSPMRPYFSETEAVFSAPLGALRPPSLANGDADPKWEPLVWLRIRRAAEGELEVCYWLSNVLVVKPDKSLETEKAASALAHHAAALREWFGHDDPSRLEMGGLLSNLKRVQLRRLYSHALLDGAEPNHEHLLPFCEALAKGEYSIRPGAYDQTGRLVEADLFVVEEGLGQPWLDTPRHTSEHTGRIRLSSTFAGQLFLGAGAELLPRTWDWGEAPEHQSETAEQQASSDVSPVPAQHDTHTGAAQSTPGTEPPQALAGGAEPDGPDQEARLQRRLAIPQEELALLADQLSRAFERNGLNMSYVDPRQADVGPRIIRLKAKPLPGETIGRVRKAAEDLALTMAVKDGVHVDLDPPYICVDLPRPVPVDIGYDEVVSSFPEAVSPGELPLLLGVSPRGEIRWEDLAQLPHLLVAGSTGSGKSVFLTTALCTLARLIPPERLELVIIDPKGLDFGPFEGIPHLSGGKVITDPQEGIEILRTLLEKEIPERKARLRDHDAVNAVELLRIDPTLLKMKVVVVDELSEMMDLLRGQKRDDFEEELRRLAQMARACGIHLILATQRPSADVITGVIKANIPARLSFRLPSHVDSRTILDTGGAETLLGKGDILFRGNASVLERLQGVLTPRGKLRSLLASVR